MPVKQICHKQLHDYTIHTEGHLAVILPDNKILIVRDMFEDPVWILNLDFVSYDTKFAVFEKLMEIDTNCIFSRHCTVDKFKAGGYDKKLYKA